jgi:hypothetical protein
MSVEEQVNELFPKIKDLTDGFVFDKEYTVIEPIYEFTDYEDAIKYSEGSHEEIVRVALEMTDEVLDQARAYIEQNGATIDEGLEDGFKVLVANAIAKYLEKKARNYKALEAEYSGGSYDSYQYNNPVDYTALTFIDALTQSVEEHKAPGR